MFSCEFCKISKNTFFTKYLWTAAFKVKQLCVEVNLHFIIIITLEKCVLNARIPVVLKYSFSSKILPSVSLFLCVRFWNTYVAFRSNHRICSIKSVLKHFSKSAGKHLWWKHRCQSLLFNKVLGLLKKVSGAGVSCEFCEIFKSTILTEHLRTTASELYHFISSHYLQSNQ